MNVCWHDTCPFEGPPVTIRQGDKDRGTFCDTSCAKAFLLDVGNTDRYIAIAHLQSRVGFGGGVITPAGSRLLLTKYGGPYTIEEFRGRNAADTRGNTVHASVVQSGSDGSFTRSLRGIRVPKRTINFTGYNHEYATIASSADEGLSLYERFLAGSHEKDPADTAVVAIAPAGPGSTAKRTPVVPPKPAKRKRRNGPLLAFATVRKKAKA